MHLIALIKKRIHIKRLQIAIIAFKSAYKRWLRLSLILFTTRLVALIALNKRF